MPPYRKIYDGTMNPEDHIIHYVTAVKGNDLSKEHVLLVLLNKFGEILTGGALTWYSELPARSIMTSIEMADKFVIAHVGAKKARVNDILAVKQSLGEGLRDFFTHFNIVRMSLPNVSEGMAVEAFQNGLNRNGSRATRKLLSRPIKYSPITWEEIHNAYYAKVRADKDELNEIVYAPEKLGPKVKWPQKMKKDPNSRKLNALYKFHQERSHMTEDCIALRQEAVNMIHQGHLRELMSNRGRANFARGREPHQGPLKPPSLASTIQMIISGGDHKLKQSITHEQYNDLEDSIIFDKSDTHGMTFPHFDALVITLRISDTDIKRIMVDDGSGECIIHPRVLTKMRLEDKIVPHCITLTCFNNAVEQTFREIILSVLAGGVTLETTFHVMNQDSPYNAIIGRPWIHSMRSIPSSLYQVIKFPTL
uniref:Uncharacterized protein LOC104233084 n=1 Tax=Nicotiana sylvestris TaxID=4096 RepID=A0A1U7XE08_NICSY|nr:PREDICTED: uncharacterized protein LOC104233084 [Nicotiana sylvestris]